LWGVKGLAVKFGISRKKNNGEGERITFADRSCVVPGGAIAGGRGEGFISPREEKKMFESTWKKNPFFCGKKKGSRVN